MSYTWQLHPDAATDCLIITACLQEADEGVTTPEIHLFAYLACLLWLFRSRPVSDWGYPFVGTKLGAPFSVAIEDSLKELLRRGHLVRREHRLITSPVANEALGNLRSLEGSKPRVECLDAACASAVALSPGIVGSALAYEPDLRRVRQTPVSRALLQEPAQKLLYKQFLALRRALETDSPDLRIPAVVWLTALYRSSDT